VHTMGQRAPLDAALALKLQVVCIRHGIAPGHTSQTPQAFSQLLSQETCMEVGSDKGFCFPQVLLAMTAAKHWHKRGMHTETAGEKECKDTSTCNSLGGACLSSKWRLLFPREVMPAAQGERQTTCTWVLILCMMQPCCNSLPTAVA
jgi:hypothetical protein